MFFQNSLNVTFCHPNIPKHDTTKFLLTDAISPHCCYLSITEILYSSLASLFDTDLMILNFTRIARTCYEGGVLE